MSLLDIYLGSNEIKNLLVERSEKFRIPFHYSCLAAGIDYNSFMESYVNARSGKPSFTEAQFEKILSCYGIETRYTIVVKEDFDHETMKLDLREKYERRR